MLLTNLFDTIHCFYVFTRYSSFVSLVAFMFQQLSVIVKNIFVLRLCSGVGVGKTQQNQNRDNLTSSGSITGISNPQASDERITLIVDNTR